jgi:hypothetical protein
MKLTFHDKRQTFDISLEKDKALWLIEMLKNCGVQNDRKMTFGQVKESFEQQFEDFELFWFSKPIEVLKKNGLLSL